MKKALFLLCLCLGLGSFSCSEKKSAEGSVPAVVAGEPLEYVLEDLSGTVLIKTVDETQPEPAEEEQTLQAGDEIITQAGSEASLTLNETTMFHLSENSDVTVSQLDRNDTQGFISRLSLASGKVLSEVEKLSDSNSTFEVSSGGVVCGVRGTSFEVEKQDSDVQTSTYNGVVAVQKDSAIQTVSAGQHGDYSNSLGSFMPNQDLTADEKDYYENWKGKLAVIRAKTHRRFEALRAIDHLPADQRQKMMDQLNGVKGKDRLKTMNEMMGGNMDQNNPLPPHQTSMVRPQDNGETLQAEHQEQQEQREQAVQQRQENRRDHPPARPKP